MSANHALTLKIPNENLEKITKREILPYICALLNSNGGTLKLYSATADNLNQDIVVRLLEVLSHNFFSNRVIQKLFTIHPAPKETPNGFIFKVPGSLELETLKYNIFLPTETQVLECRSTHEIRQIIERKICELNEDEVPANFIYGQRCGLRESQTVQFKNLKTEATKNFTFAKRVIHNKFTQYVSAFANHRGGRIYYGINDDGVVVGEVLNDDEKDRVVNRIKTVIGKMPVGASDSSASGIQCNVDFTPVKKDASSDEIVQSTFVMIVSISPFLGGVFIEDPESYCIENKEVVRIKFNDWLVYFKMGRLPWSITVTSLHLSNCVQWSSVRRRSIYLKFTIELVQSRNENNMKKFRLWEMLAKHERYHGTDAALIVLMEKIAVHYKNHDFDDADALLRNEIWPALRRSLDPQFHETKALYLKSRIKRAQGKYEDSYKDAKDCLRSMANLPAEFITVWCYMQLAMLENILGARENDLDKFLQARRWLDLALRHARALEEFPSGLHDVQQKLFIYRAMTLLKCSLTGEIANLAVTAEDVDAAVNELTKVYKSDMKGNMMSRYREIQYLFGQCCVFLRHSEHTKSMPECRKKLKRAKRWAGQAKNLAGDFKDMVNYAASFQMIVKERITRCLQIARRR